LPRPEGFRLHWQFGWLLHFLRLPFLPWMAKQGLAATPQGARLANSQ
jgi:hypothetical protein